MALCGTTEGAMQIRLTTAAWLVVIPLGCGTTEPAYPDRYTTTEGFRIGTEERTPLGVPLAAAERTMTAHGFRCHAATWSHVSLRDTLVEPAHACLRQDGERIWSVFVVHQEGRVTARHTGTGVRATNDLKSGAP